MMAFLLPNLANICSRIAKLSSIDSVWIIISSIKIYICEISCKIFEIKSRRNLGALCRPNGNLLNSNFPEFVTKAVLCQSDLDIFTWQNSFFRSIFEKIFDLEIYETIQKYQGNDIALTVK
ncbi:hypothetical protein DMUE_2777 [Dictyocoela muelleri]|nr:hypothetical protein DMUE_2777 [Dictyocoela muelleri]